VLLKLEPPEKLLLEKLEPLEKLLPNDELLDEKLLLEEKLLLVEEEYVLVEFRRLRRARAS
jgi:hypothetical protein